MITPLALAAPLVRQVMGNEADATLTRRGFVAGLAAAVTLAPMLSAHAVAPTTDPQLDRAADAALKKLYGSNQAARTLGQKAVGILVFPKIVKAGFLIGGAYGEGALKQNGKTVSYYHSVAASYGLQAGVQWFGYALFFMNDGAMKYLDDSRGFEIGVGPSIVVVDEGIAKKLSSTTVTQDVYAFVFSQKGLMAGLGIEGSKITKI
jgi:lipid-binding SYLF domain-containing protein